MRKRREDKKSEERDGKQRAGAGLDEAVGEKEEQRVTEKRWHGGDGVVAVVGGRRGGGR
jgi:hypothetical protein